MSKKNEEIKKLRNIVDSQTTQLEFLIKILKNISLTKLEGAIEDMEVSKSCILNLEKKMAQWKVIAANSKFLLNSFLLAELDRQSTTLPLNNALSSEKKFGVLLYFFKIEPQKAQVQIEIPTAVTHVLETGIDVIDENHGGIVPVLLKPQHELDTRRTSEKCLEKVTSSDISAGKLFCH